MKGVQRKRHQALTRRECRSPGFEMCTLGQPWQEAREQQMLVEKRTKLEIGTRKGFFCSSNVATDSWTPNFLSRSLLSTFIGSKMGAAPLPFSMSRPPWHGSFPYFQGGGDIDSCTLLQKVIIKRIRLFSTLMISLTASELQIPEGFFFLFNLF